MMTASRLRWAATALAIAAGATAWGEGPTATPTFLGPKDVDWRAVLPGPPAAGSAESKRELAELLEWQAKRTPTDVARCRAEAADPSPFLIFADVLGEGFTVEALPVTAHVLDQANTDLKRFTKPAKKHWDRTRPATADDRIHPCVPDEATASYPSAHAVRGVVWAAILSDLFPDKKPQLVVRGDLLGQDRVVSGEHFPSDVTDGQKLGAAVAQKLEASVEYQTELAQAKAEVARRYKSATTRPAG